MFIRQGKRITKGFMIREYIQWLTSFSYIQRSKAIEKGIKEYSLSPFDCTDIFNQVYKNVNFR